jgi:putative methionine-R-sulfoxide reductase with GAF domain
MSVALGESGVYLGTIDVESELPEAFAPDLQALLEVLVAEVLRRLWQR